jgi:hypothetical protein
MQSWWLNLLIWTFTFHSKCVQCREQWREVRREPAPAVCHGPSHSSLTLPLYRTKPSVFFRTSLNFNLTTITYAPL